MHQTHPGPVDLSRKAAHDAAIQSDMMQTVVQRLAARSVDTARAEADALQDRAARLAQATAARGPQGLAGAWGEYVRDTLQRGVLMADVMRRWSDMHIEHEEAGAPPVLYYDFEVVLDGRHLPMPCNYVLLRIHPDGDQEIHEWKRPYVIIDPRAGHGPGIGGFKADSQVGVALAGGHPVYFVAFRQMPEPGQTLASVTHAEAAFLREVGRRHPESRNPVVIGNCQGGWATAILAATNPDLAGPIVLNGAPMSYWSGKLGQDPMRYSGGLMAGALPAHLASDLGGGVFDGAFLVQNFENLNPGRNYFAKFYDVFADPDGQAERFLGFEKWWGAFYMMNGQEIGWIVDQLFVGNRLSSNTAQLEPGRPIDLKAIRAPIICFASHGDNITPVGQALNWIVDTYASEKEIEILGQRIFYLVNDEVGHLGIFVSGKVAKREHQQMSSVLGTIEALPPGLYEIVIEDVEGEGHGKTFTVSFARRTFEDVASHSGRRRDEPAFNAVARMSDSLLDAYRTTLQPVLQTAVIPQMGEAMRAANPRRAVRKAFATSVPGMAAVPGLGERVRAERAQAAADNPFLLAERMSADLIETSFNAMRDMREAMQEVMFFAMWANPLAVAYGAGRPHGRTHKRPEDLVSLPAVQDAIARVEEGGFAEGFLRILILLAGTRKDVRGDRLERSSAVISSTPPFDAISPADRAEMIARQTLIVEYARDAALASLPKLLPEPKEAARAMERARYIVGEPSEMTAETRAMMERIDGLLGTGAASGGPAANAAE